MKTYYIFSSGVLKREGNSVLLEVSNGEKKFIPIENIEQIYVFGEVHFNNKFLNFISQYGICLHVFNYYGFYSGSFYPRETLLSGDLTVKQAEAYLDNKKRIEIASLIIDGAIHNIKRNIEKREIFDKEIKMIKDWQDKIKGAKTIGELMSMEAHVRRIYYGTFERITNWKFEERTKMPPRNPLNALISFGNTLVYTTILKELYLTPLNPTISFLHEPSERRFSLSLDISEIFKPILSDRLIFKLINLKEIKQENFEESLGGIYLKDDGRKIFVENYDNLLETTILHRKLKKKVKYKTLIKLELYKLIKHILGEKKYQPLKVWW
jgi:CRISPR-associated protein Cas1